MYHGDNLDFLRGMNSESVDLIATDPPFNKGRDFHATPDSLASGAKFQDRWSWEKDVHQEWVDQITDDWPKTMNVIQGSRWSYGDDIGAFLCFMAVRLIEMRRVLKSTGSLYLHCDPTASHYLKELMDAIFGRRNFRNEIVWRYSGWNKRLKSHLERRHDIILFYAKSPKARFNYPTRPWRNKEEYVRVRKQKIRVDEQGREYVLSDAGGGKRVNRYLSDAMQYGVPLDSVWSIPKLNNSDKIERTGFPTQKPLALYERIIKASSNEGDLVLDPFCGCATTPIAAERLKRQWIGMDIWDGAEEVVLDRLAKEGLFDPDDKTKGLLFRKDIHFTSDPAIRTDDGQEATPYLMVQEKTIAPKDPYSRAEKVDRLLQKYGYICQGCLREFDDLLYFELDHNNPKSAGGSNLLENRILLCSPCNRIKSDALTLHGLRQENWRRKRMSKMGEAMKKDLRKKRGLLVSALNTRT